MGGITAWARIVTLIIALTACVPDLAADDGDRVTPTPRPDARPSGTLTVAIDPIPAVDPGLVDDRDGGLVIRTACDRLIGTDPATGELVGVLAESWTIAGSGSRVFVRLRDDITFSDGSPVTADDIVFTLSRVASQDFASPAADLLQDVAGYPEIHGDVPARDDRFLERLAGVRASDGRTVEISLTEPDASFVHVLAHPAMTPVPRAAVEADPDGFERRPICAGPYAFTRDFAVGEPIELARADSTLATHPALTRGGAGYADRIRFLPGARRADVTSNGDGALIDAGRLEVVGFPTSIEPFDRPNVRHALSLAIDRERIRDAMTGETTIARGFTPGSETCGASTPAGGRPGRARRVLGDDALPERFTFTFNRGFDNEAVARRIARDWERAFDVEVSMNALSFEEFITVGRSTGGFDGPFRFSWAPRYPSPAATLVPLFDDGSIGVHNLSRFDDATFADAVRAVRRTVDDDERAAGWAIVEQVVCAAMPMAPLTWDLTRVTLSDGWVAARRDVIEDRAWGEPLLREIARG